MSMNIYAPEGTKVRYTGIGGYQGNKDHANKHLVVGETYTVLDTEVHSSISYVYLKEVPKQSFNTVMFEEINEPSL